jgi:hypothetical protein
MVYNTNIRGNVPKNYFPISWLSDKSEIMDFSLALWMSGIDNRWLVPRDLQYVPIPKVTPVSEKPPW